MFEKPILNFADNLSSLRDFVDLVDSFLTQQKERVLEDHEDDIRPIFEAVQSTVSKEEIPEEDDDVRQYVEVNTDELEDGKGIIGFRASGEPGARFNAAMNKVGKSEKRIRLLYNSALMNLVSSVEVFFSQLLHQYFRKYPDALGRGEKAFSLKDLDQYNTIEDAREAYISSKIENVLRDSFDEWVATFRSRMNLSMSYLEEHMEVLVETFKRRNLVVHNAGIVNRTYLSSVADQFRESVESGDRLIVERGYLDERIGLLERNCLLIAFELWKKVDQEDEDRGKLLSDISYDHLLEERYEVAESLGYFLSRDKRMPEPFRLVGKLNRWLSIKRQGRWEEVRQEAEQADFTAKERRFRLAHAALCDRHDRFFEVLPDAIRGGGIEESELKNFPIFADVRDDDRFDEVVSELETKDGA